MAVRAEILHFFDKGTSCRLIEEWFKEHPWLRPSDVMAIPRVEKTHEHAYGGSGGMSGVYLVYPELEDPYRGNDPGAKHSGG